MYGRYVYLSVCFWICIFSTVPSYQFCGVDEQDLMLDRIFRMLNQNCRKGVYPRSNIHRFEVSEDKVPWKTELPEYNPPDYTALKVYGAPWADPDIDDPEFKPKWNEIDGNISRKSYTGNYIVKEGRPLNPVGRTGIIGRGLLGRWGPNHAGDPIVTRWKRNGTGAVEISRATEKPILQFVAIQRGDTGEWALPGGMVDPGEAVASTVQREFMEEALNSLEKDDLEIDSVKETLKKFFENGDNVYQGYVDDPRNTDNSWMETVALNFHDEDGSIVGKINLQAGDDAANVRWMDMNKELALYSSHGLFVKLSAQKHNAHW